MGTRTCWEIKSIFLDCPFVSAQKAGTLGLSEIPDSQLLGWWPNACSQRKALTESPQEPSVWKQGLENAWKGKGVLRRPARPLPQHWHAPALKELPPDRLPAKPEGSSEEPSSCPHHAGPGSHGTRVTVTKWMLPSKSFPRTKPVLTPSTPAPLRSHRGPSLVGTHKQEVCTLHRSPEAASWVRAALMVTLVPRHKVPFQGHLITHTVSNLQLPQNLTIKDCIVSTTIPKNNFLKLNCYSLCPQSL